MPIQSRNVRRHLDTDVHTQHRKICAVDDAASQRGHSLGHGETIIILTLAYFVIYCEIRWAYYPDTNFKMLRGETQNLDSTAHLLEFSTERLTRDSQRVCPGHPFGTRKKFFFAGILAD